ncbi:hypothetical protein F2Q70_00042392 [Brassica cretica]|uniref:Uncharacterized protein n=1 Tax=Brassica cretica TaxID=69181 RepID=A0A8S9KFE0_BRACR|nr:hypothetical protein F2Q70_00042392 [Brassica cretica]
MVATLILERGENGDLHDQEGHLRNAAVQRLDDQRAYHVNAIIEDDLWHVSKEEKLQERDFDVKSSMSFGGSHWCRPTPSDEHQSMDWDEHRSTSDVQHRSTESVALCKMVRIMTHDEFAAKHPHPPKPFHVNINRKSEQTADRERELTADQQPTLVLDRRAPLCYRVQLPKINLAQLYALRNPSQPSETPTDNIKITVEVTPAMTKFPITIDNCITNISIHRQAHVVFTFSQY